VGEIMRRVLVLVILSMAFLMTGCDEIIEALTPGENSAVITTTNLASSGRSIIIDADNPGETEPVVLGAVSRVKKSIRSGDNSRIFSIGSNNYFSVVDVKTQTCRNVDIERNYWRIWDIALSADGSLVFVGTRDQIYIQCRIEVYDAESLEFKYSFDLKKSFFDYYRIGLSMVVNPVKDEIYVTVIGDIIQPVRLRTFDFTGNRIGEEYRLNADYFDYNYAMGVSSNGQLLICVSDKIYPFSITDTGLEQLNPISERDGEKLKFNGKTNVLFSEDFNMVYITSSGIYLPGTTNLGGYCACLGVQKILNNDEDPFYFSVVDFFHDDFVKWLATQLNSDIGDLLDPTQLYGVADAVIEGNTVYMIIASVMSMAADTVDLQNGKYILSIFHTLPFGGNIWLGGKSISSYPNSLAVNKKNDTMVVTYKWKKQVEILKKRITWLTTSSEIVDLAEIDALGSTNYPESVGIGTVKKDNQ